ncbi:12575_t:CDS:2 [Ambispora leptoticha]|uniref:12575_t:CDS:1 n=1 Tax=Ambispora leptoticha TaxID=144679 RepID=A0A9N9FP40_9GLOM|nr:12575_t:CDS:2 [Ambispora leptoticha]
MTKEIQLAAKMGGADPTLNIRLAAALAAAKKANVPKDNIDNAIKRATGQKDENAIESITYEGYGPNGVAFIIETLTNNRNRTVKDIKSIFTKHGGSMSTVNWMFEKKGQIQFSKGSTQDSVDAMIENAMEIDGVEDIQELDDDLLEITCQNNAVNAISENLTKKYRYAVTSMRSGYIPTTTIPLVEDEERDKVMAKFVNALNDHEDVVEFYNNAVIGE